MITEATIIEFKFAQLEKTKIEQVKLLIEEKEINTPLMIAVPFLYSSFPAMIYYNKTILIGHKLNIVISGDFVSPEEYKVKVVPWEHYENPIDAANKVINEGISLVLIEQTVKSKSIYLSKFSYPLCFIVGNEVSGVSDELSSLATQHIEIPMRGIKQSLNVSVATGVIGYEFARKYSSEKKLIL